MLAPDVQSAAASENQSWTSIAFPVEAELQQVRQRIRQVLAADHPLLHQRLLALAETPGKMLRPLVFLLSIQTCGQVQPAHIDLAAAVELIHMATLLHDDVVDQAVLRRGRPSANCLWGNTAAVLLGDLLLSRALVLGSQLYRPDLTEQVVQAAQQICQGELLQNLHQGNWEMNEELYEHIIEAKTAALFAASCSLGAQLAEADNSSVQALNQYGQKFGLAFQICDDCMDLFGNEEKTGKTIGIDLAEGKPTLPVILWLKNLSESDRKKALSLLANPKKHRSSIAKKIRQSEVIKQIQQKLLALQKQAQEALAPLAHSAAKTSLCRLVESITASVNLSRLPQ